MRTGTEQAATSASVHRERRGGEREGNHIVPKGKETGGREKRLDPEAEKARQGGALNVGGAQGEARR